MSRASFLFPLILILTVLLDTVAGPFLVGTWMSFHFTAAAVALIGLKRGKWHGLAGGWLAGLLFGSLSSAPLGLCMLSLGCAGFFAGFLRGLGELRLPIVDGTLLIGFLFLEDALSGLGAQILLGVSWHPAFAGILASALVILLLLRRRVESLIA